MNGRIDRYTDGQRGRPMQMTREQQNGRWVQQSIDLACPLNRLTDRWTDGQSDRPQGRLSGRHAVGGVSPAACWRANSAHGLVAKYRKADMLAAPISSNCGSLVMPRTALHPRILQPKRGKASQHHPGTK